MASEKVTYDLQIRCKYCDRFLNVKAISSSHITVRCTDRKCKMDNDIKIVMLSDHVKEEHDDGKECNKVLKDFAIKQPTNADVEELKLKAKELDQRTKEAKKLQAKIADMEKYIASLEGIVDGQG